MAGPLRHIFAAALTIPLLSLSVGRLSAQGRGHEEPAVRVTAEITLSVGQQQSIRSYYDAHARADVDGLPPGIRKKLARGKPLPPGIAKKVAPPELVSGLAVPSGYELVEVGLDVLLVEVATGIVHDVLMDVIR